MVTKADEAHVDLEVGGSRSEIVRAPEKKSADAGVDGREFEGCVGGVDLENGEVKVERDCRICHLSLSESPESLEGAIVLGCSCKDDLAAAHRHCAEAWFKIKGNKTCEICGAVARNVSGPTELEPSEDWNESNDATPPPQPARRPTETQNFWKGHRFLNFLLACMVFAFVISWLFHFNIHSRET